MRYLVFISIFIFNFLNHVYGQNTISGYIIDEETKEALPYANISSCQNFTTSNGLGFFTINIEDGCDTIITSYLGYTSYTYQIDREDQNLEDIVYIALKKGVELTEVQILATSKKDKANQSLGQVNINVEQLKTIPTFLGEQDVIKTLSYAPGISTGYAGSSGLFVRGGTPDQNLLLLDDAKIYNGSHLFGFISTINPDVVKDARVYKGDFPSKYGGRLSSVLDIRTKDGNKTKTNRELTIGLLSSKYFHEQPLGKSGNTSIVFGGRVSYLSLVTLPQLISFNNGKSDKYDSYWMYDLTAKIHHKIDDKSFASISFFRGGDNYTNKSRIDSLISFSTQDWGNTASSLKYSRIVGSNTFWNTTLSYNAYHATNKDNGPLGNQNVNGIVTSKIEGLTLRSDVERSFGNNSELTIGVELNTERLNPSTISYYEDNTETTTNLWGLQDYTQTYSLYIGSKHKLFNKFSIEPGLRYALYRSAPYVDHFIEPRLNVLFDLNETDLVKFSYAHMNQNINYLSNNGLGLPTDFWLPSVEEYPASKAQNLSLGYFTSNKDWDFSVECFYKYMSDLVALRDGTDYFDIERPITSKIQSDGIGKAYGVEFLIRKNAGKLNGWIAYTLARNTRRFDNINKGKWFPFKYDRRHDISIVANYELGKKWFLTGGMKYSTGIAVTLPSSFIDTPLYTGYIYSGRNQSRLRDYFNLDLSFVKRKKRWELSLGVNNATSRFNPISSEPWRSSIYDRSIPDNEQERIGLELSLRQNGFAYPIPYISYKFLFDK